MKWDENVANLGMLNPKMADTKINFYVLTFWFALKQNGHQNHKFGPDCVQNTY